MAATQPVNAPAIVPSGVVPSPCVGVCAFDPATGWCLGCARTADEIATWREVAADARQRVWDRLPGRRAALGLVLHRMAWTAADIRAFALRALAPGAGNWVVGIHGAVGEFSAAPGETVRIARRGDALEAATAQGALRLAVEDSTRALGLAAGGGSPGLRAIVLAVPRVRLALPVHGAVTPLGPDAGAIGAQDRAAPLYDLGLGSPAAQFCIRSAEPAMLDVLAAAAGRPWMQAMGTLGPAALAHAPHRVVLTQAARVEVYAPIPPPGDRSPPGPHTHLLPDCLALGRETSPDLDLPAAYAPAAIFYPAPDGPLAGVAG